MIYIILILWIMAGSLAAFMEFFFSIRKKDEITLEHIMFLFFLVAGGVFSFFLEIGCYGNRIVLWRRKNYD